MCTRKLLQFCTFSEAAYDIPEPTEVSAVLFSYLLNFHRKISSEPAGRLRHSRRSSSKTGRR
ncbi:hypothetical protein M758_5G018000 [Ceratodon purpureus]|nr:hypothetical protein M758_5G018000 [Ceratodon purpureus]